MSIVLKKILKFNLQIKTRRYIERDGRLRKNSINTIVEEKKILKTLS